MYDADDNDEHGSSSDDRSTGNTMFDRKYCARPLGHISKKLFAQMHRAVCQQWLSLLLKIVLCCAYANQASSQ